jgi:NAD(P) transhydrogenase subunit alpha
VAEQVESMGAAFVYLDFDEQQDGAATGGYAAVSSPEFREAQLAKFREIAPDMDIVITTALIPNREAPELWTEDMVAAQKRGSVIVDLAAEKGGNCKLTVMDEKIISENGVTIIGYTDFPSRMATQASTLYGNNIGHMLADLTPEKDGIVNHNMEDDVIRSATVAYAGDITFPPPPLKVQAIAAKPQAATVQKTPEELKAIEVQEMRAAGTKQTQMLIAGGIVMAFLGMFAPASFMQHFIVFVLAVFIGFQVIWNVSHALHTPLMAITNAISGIIIIGALLQVSSGGWFVGLLAGISILIATVNIVGGFMVTRRMLAMFQKS